MISPETIEQVRSRMSVIRVIEKYVKLEKRGRTHTGLCPFHKEKTPSFHVNDERNFYHCFGCGASGDPLKFLMELEGLSFLEAVRQIAELESISIIEVGNEQERKQAAEARRRVEQLYDAGALAAAYFERMLREHPLAHLAREELAKRGLSLEPGSEHLEALKDFRVGYAPYGWDSLTQQLREQGANIQAADRAGLIAPRKNGPGHYDRFRHRLMFAVMDLSGRIVAFSGRALAEPSEAELVRARLVPMSHSSGDAPAKYLNSPESPIYKKRQTLFGLYQARHHIRNLDQCVLVEGNFDVLSLHARGLKHVVAPLGTAFTAEQGREIKRYSSQAVLLFDSDSAGKKATHASRAPAKEAGLILRVGKLPDGADPDDLARRAGIDAVKQVVSSAQPILEYLIDQALDEPADGAIERANLVRRVKQLIAEEEDATVRMLAEDYAVRVAERLGIQDDATLSAVRATLKQTPQTPNPRRAPPQSFEAYEPSEPSRSPLELSPESQPPERARSRNRAAEIQFEVLGAFLDFPSFFSDPESLAAGELLKGDLVLAYLNLRNIWRQQVNGAQGTGPSQLGSPDEILAVLPHSIHPFAAKRLVAPKHEQIEPARTELNANLKTLMRLRDADAKAQNIAELQEAAAQGDFEHELRLLKERYLRAKESKR